MVVLPINDQIYSTEIRPRRERWLSGKKIIASSNKKHRKKMEGNND